LSQAVMPLTCIMEVPSSNFGWNTDCTDSASLSVFVCLSSRKQDELWNTSQAVSSQTLWDHRTWPPTQMVLCWVTYADDAVFLNNVRSIQQCITNLNGDCEGTMCVQYLSLDAMYSDEMWCLG
jgi:hypothetical protein